MNEKGYSYPLTVALCFMCLSLIAFQVKMVQREAAFYEDTKEYYKLRIMMVEAVSITMEDFNSERLDDRLIEVDEGVIEIEYREDSDDFYQVEIVCKTMSGIRYSISFDWDVNKKEIVRWTDWEI
ncbi:competence type IV pilus minor pilin ComGG [Bacillus carboniphilus]|uniref:Competence type IV pilus minor pilin ComGG n=1 Tax=Bacillus carboniphilus TaxID=86663 RepID=A0ABY9K0R2_9BACI|nr:competence type IV pilus minor pilin ComGG [Bacillus carboniphilus]WLR44280.1 competence type IV pilus minor pilin ComGG [Bacillus carboniphilus]